MTRKKPAPAKNGDSRRHRKPEVKIVVTLGDITQVAAPFVCVGSYKGIAPTSALGALDEALGHYISRAVEQGAIGADLGELFHVPVLDKQVAASSVLIAGMGEYGKFSYSDLRYLLMNVCYSVATLRQKSFAGVLIGSGEGSLEIDEALKGMLSGICDALHRVNPCERVEEFRLVEFRKQRYEEIRDLLREYERDQVIENLKLTVAEDKLPQPRGWRAKKGGAGAGRKASAAAADASNAAPSVFVNRVTIETDPEGGYNFSALTNNAVIPVRRVEVQRFFTDGIAAQLMNSLPDEQEDYGLTLFRYMIPEDFERFVDNGRPLTLVLDPHTAGLPWEMACYGPAGRRRFFGTDLKLTRQFRTMLSGAPGIAPPLNKSLRCLVIADPAPDDLALEGARKEGEEVVELLQSFKTEFDRSGALDLEIVAHIGPENCNPVEILSLVLNETFDVIHYSGHGVFDAQRPNRSGWVFGHTRDGSELVVLSAREIFRARQVPRLVFANACFSAVTSPRKEAPTADESNRQLAGLAEAFFERGVQNYVGTGWEVGDAAAVTFARLFYERALAGRMLGESLSEARRAIFDQGPTWGAYQHYGHSGARLTV